MEHKQPKKKPPKHSTKKSGEAASRTAEANRYMRGVTALVMSRDPDPEARDPGPERARAGSRLLWLADVVATRKPLAVDEFVRIIAEVARTVAMDPPSAPGCHRCGARVQSGAQIAGLLRPLWDAPRPEIARPFYDDPLGRWWLHERLFDAASRLDGYCSDKCVMAEAVQELDASKARA